MSKPIVHFIRDAHFIDPVIGQRTSVVTLDHPATDRETPGKEAITSPVVDVFSDGSFETRNTHYVPASAGEPIAGVSP